MQSLSTYWNVGRITEWADKCLEKCTNQAKRSGFPQGCCEARKSGYCKFYPEGSIKQSNAHYDAKAVLCQSTGTMINSIYLTTNVGKY